MISYCIVVLRPIYARLLIEDLVAKGSVQFEVLIWLNIDDLTFEQFLHRQIERGAPIVIVGKTPENIGMSAYRELFQVARFPLVVQVDDDVVRVSRGIAERATRLFQRFPRVRQLVADVWQDEYTTGARPPLSGYRAFDQEEGLYDGPVDGWFSIYHRSILPMVHSLPLASYFPLGGTIRNRLMSRGLRGLLDTKMKVFHVIGPAYASFFGMLEFEIHKYQRLGRAEIVNWYRDARQHLPPRARLEEQFARISQSLDRNVTGCSV
jgi:hypothetical protein